MNKRDILTLAEEIIGGGTPDNKRYRELLATPDNEIFGMLCGADMVRDYYFDCIYGLPFGQHEPGYARLYSR